MRERGRKEEKAPATAATTRGSEGNTAVAVVANGNGDRTDGWIDERCLRPKRGNAPSSQHSGPAATSAAAAISQIEVKYGGKS